MTSQEKLHAIETAIRKALPRLMEPTEGCLVIFRNIKNKKQSGKISYLYGQDFYRIFCKNESDEYFRRRGEVEILGHDILLSDVLEWFDKLKFNPNEPVSLLDETLTEQGIISIIALWCLSKPHLKDQSEGLWNFLYNLLEDNE